MNDTGTETLTLSAAIARLKHVYMQTDATRTLTIETHGNLAQKIAPDEFAVFKHHFNNTVAFFHNDMQELTPEMAMNDPEIRNILHDALTEILGRPIDDAHGHATDISGYADTAEILATEIESKLAYLKRDDLANARELIGELRSVPENAAELVIAINNVLALLPPEKKVVAGNTQSLPLIDAQHQR